MPPGPRPRRRYPQVRSTFCRCAGSSSSTGSTQAGHRLRGGEQEEEEGDDEGDDEEDVEEDVEGMREDGRGGGWRWQGG
eukprot:9264258-Pyramimonas_sp.AAC.1